MRTKTKRLLLLLMAGLFVLPSLLAVAAPQSVYAAAENPEDQLERWLYYRGMRACLETPDWGRTDSVAFSDDNDGSRTRDEINAGHLLPGGTLYIDADVGFGYLGKDMDNDDSNDGTVDCDDGSIFVRGSKAFGFPSVLHMICAMNRAATELDMGNKIDPEGDAGDCEEASSIRFHHVEDSGDAFQRILTRALDNEGSGERPPFHFNDNNGDGYTYKSLLYLLGKNSLETFCGGALGSANANDSYDGDDKAVSVYIVENGEIKKSDIGEAGFSHSYAVTKKDSESDTVNDVYYSNGGNDNEADDRSCADMARWTREGARDYAEWAAVNGELAEENEAVGGSNSDSASGDGEEEKTSCGIDGIGWIVCPVLTFMGGLTDSIFTMVAAYLSVNPEMTSGDTTQKAWEQMRNIANVIFVIGFLIIIYSQMTGAGLSNYGIKKLLPKLIAVAILVNASLFICQIAVDLSNILGYSLKSLFESIGSTIQLPTADVGEGATGGLSKFMGAAIVGLLAVAGVAVFGGLALLFPILILAIIALVMTILILIGRQALIVLLIVISPLAFAAYLLPNTEQWYKRWQKMFVGVLMVFPIISVVFGASALASTIFYNVATGGGELNGADEPSLYINQIIAVGIAVIPLIVVPGLLKKSLSAVDGIGDKIASMDRKANSHYKGRAKEGYQQSSFARGRADRKRAHTNTRNMNYAKAVAGQDTSLRGKAGRRLSRGVTGRRFTKQGWEEQKEIQSNALSAVTAAQNKEYEEAVAAAATAHSTQGISTKDLSAMAASGMNASGAKVSEQERAAAVDAVMKSGSFDERRAALEGMASPVTGASKSLKKRAVQGAFAKGDNGIYGNGFGQKIVDGNITGATGLAQEAVKNAADGNVSAEHLAGSASGTKWLVDQSVSKQPNAQAVASLQVAAGEAVRGDTTKAKLNQTHADAFKRL